MTNKKIIGKGQNKELFLEFIDFCDSKPKKLPVDHSCWDNCAVGEFLGPRLTTGMIKQVLGDDSDKNNLCWVVSQSQRICPTYGDMTDLLKSYLPSINIIV